MGTRARAVLLLTIFATFALASGFVAAQEGGNETNATQEGAGDPLSGPSEVTYEIRLGSAGGGFTIHPLEFSVPSNAQVTFHVVNVGSTPHDWTLLADDFQHSEEDVREREDGGQAVKTPLLEAGESYNLTVTFGEGYSGEIEHICSVPGHAEAGMDGTFTVGATGGGGGEEGIEDFGVDYLAYWVGVISFVIVFIVLFATFFFLRYGETKHATDHRAGGPQTITVAAGTAEGEEREMVEPLLPSPGRVAQVLIAVALIGLGIYLIL
jgi:uncharacterized cupredoxin-like copper-binding protein